MQIQEARYRSTIQFWQPVHNQWTVSNLSLQGPHILDSTSALELYEIPKNMLVVGGGYIGLELGSVFATLGKNVSVVEMLPGLLPGVERDLFNIISRRLEKLFKSIMPTTKVAHMEETTKGIRVQLEGEKIEETEQVCEKILISVGRKPNTSGLGLENTKVEIDRKGFVVVDAQRRTKEPTIYAIGDVAGEPRGLLTKRPMKASLRLKRLPPVTKLLSSLGRYLLLYSPMLRLPGAV